MTWASEWHETWNSKRFANDLSHSLQRLIEYYNFMLINWKIGDPHANQLNKIWNQLRNKSITKRRKPQRAFFHRTQIHFKSNVSIDFSKLSRASARLRLNKKFLHMSDNLLIDNQTKLTYSARKSRLAHFRLNELNAYQITPALTIPTLYLNTTQSTSINYNKLTNVAFFLSSTYKVLDI